MEATVEEPVEEIPQEMIRCPECGSECSLEEARAAESAAREAPPAPSTEDDMQRVREFNRGRPEMRQADDEAETAALMQRTRERMRSRRGM